MRGALLRCEELGSSARFDRMKQKPMPVYLAVLIVVGGATLMFVSAHAIDVAPLQTTLLGAD
jgi:hypothetical protein